MNQRTISPATATSRTKRVAMGAASVLTAGALLGVGVQGATAAPIAAEQSSSTSTTASTTSHDAFLGSLAKEIRGDLAHGQSGNVKAQKVAATLSGHPALFATLPANLQADLTTLTDATGAADRAAAVETVRSTALAGGYGEQITAIVEAVRDNPEHPLAAALRVALNTNLGSASEAGASPTEQALKLADNPALLESLPADLQADLIELKNAPAEEQEAGAQAIETAALNGDYGTPAQKMVERVQSIATAGAGAGAGADADVNAGN